MSSPRFFLRRMRAFAFSAIALAAMVRRENGILPVSLLVYSAVPLTASSEWSPSQG